MKLNIFEDSANYTAQVIKLPVKESVEGLDNLVKVNVFGNDCLIGKDSDETELYLFFPAGTQLTETFVKGNNLYREQQLNADTNKKGFFELNRRVKAIKFRGIISTGFVIPISSLVNAFENGIDRDWSSTSIWKLSEGDSFNEIDYVEICRKYFIPGPTEGTPKSDKQNRVNNRLENLMVPNQFRFHGDTGHLANNIHVLQPSDIIVITDKWHGSSCILSQVYVVKKLNLWQKFINLIGGKVPAKEYGYIYSSGKPKSRLPKGIEGAWINDGPDFYSSNIWKDALDRYKHAIEPGISLFGELVGFEASGKGIQGQYDYGCEPGTNKLVIYRITYTKPDGSVIEFSWQQIKDYCKKYELETVKEFYFGSVEAIAFTYAITAESLVEFEEFKKLFLETMATDFNLEKDCKHCKNKVPAEGITLRIDGGTTYNTFKLKSKRFLKKESDDLDNGVENIEDQQ